MQLFCSWGWAGERDLRPSAQHTRFTTGAGVCEGGRTQGGGPPEAGRLTAAPHKAGRGRWATTHRNTAPGWRRAQGRRRHWSAGATWGRRRHGRHGVGNWGRGASGAELGEQEARGARGEALRVARGAGRGVALGLWVVVYAATQGTLGAAGAGRPWCKPEPLAGAPTDRGARALPARSASTPETWAKFTQENLYRAERERLASVNLRKLVDCILQDASEDLRLQCDAVNLAFGRRCEELEDARHKLEHYLRKVGPPGHAHPTSDHAHPAARPRPSRRQATPSPRPDLAQGSL